MRVAEIERDGERLKRPMSSSGLWEADDDDKLFNQSYSVPGAVPVGGSGQTPGGRREAAPSACAAGTAAWSPGRLHTVLLILHLPKLESSTNK
jgi:hypothetical protein